MKRESRKIINRNGSSCCDICGKQGILHSHHIEGREIPNANHMSNIANICPSCHMEVHYGNYIIEKWVMTTNGKILIWHKKNEKSFTGENANPNLLI